MTIQAPLLVTGAAGFIGARFVESCRARGQDVVSVDTLPCFMERAEHRGLDFGRQVDRDILFRWLETESPPLAGIVHLGACTDTTELDEEYLRRVNLEYSQRLWDFAISKALPMVYASSAATYGDGALGYSDDEALIPQLRPLNPYGESKRLFDLWALEREKAGQAPPAWSGFKFFNVYGFGERHKGKMASVVLHSRDRIQSTGTARLFKSHKAGIADGHQSRDFVHVGDVVKCLHFALEKPIKRGIFNLGTGQARTFLDLAKATFQALGALEKIEFVDTPQELRERYQYFTQADVAKLRAEGYAEPFTPLEAGVTEYVRRLDAV